MRGCPFETASDILYNMFLLNRIPLAVFLSKSDVA